MAPPETDEGTSGPLAYLLLVPLLVIIVGLPTVVFTAVFYVTLVAIEPMVGLPTVTLGLFELVGLPATADGVPLLYAVGPALLLSGTLLYWTGLDWEGTDGGTSGTSGWGR